MLVFCVLFPLFFWGCGDKVVDPADTTDSQLVGLWDSVSNNATVCHERIKLNADGTFAWFNGKDTLAGSYARNEPHQLNFMFTTQGSELVRYQLTERELFLTRTGATRVYIKVPANTTTSPCPIDR